MRSNKIDDSLSHLARLGTRLSTILILIVTSSLTCHLEGQSPNSGRVVRESGRIEIQSNTPRPMSATVSALGEDFGWSVDYEDPPHGRDSSDVADMTDPTWRSKHPSELVNGLKGGAFTTHLTLAEAASTSTPTTTVERIVSEYNESSLPGRFAVRVGEKGRIAVVGIATRNSAGAYEHTQVLLDTPLEGTPTQATLYDALSMLTAELTKISGHQVVVGTAPVNVLSQVQYVTPSEKLSSRAAINRILDSAPFRLAYYLLYDLNQDLYVLNIGAVTRVSTTTNGAEVRSAVPQQK